MALTLEQQEAVKRIQEKNMGVPTAQNVSREQARQLIGLEDVQKQAKERLGFFGRAKERFQGAIERSTRDIGSAIQAQERGQQGTARTAFQSIGSLLVGGADVVYGTLIDAAIPEPVAQLAKDKFEELSKTDIGKNALQAVASGVETFESIAEKNPGLARDLKALSGFIALVPGVQTITGGVSRTASATRQGTRRVFDTAKSVEDRVKKVRETVMPTGQATRAAFTEGVEAGAEQAAKSTAERAFESFVNNPTISGTIDDIKVMVGLPESTPAVDLTFRAIKPRITKDKDLRRVKAQMELANQTIAQKGNANRIVTSDAAVREYADAIYDTKKQVWADIQSKLDAGQAAELRIDLVPVAVELLDMASDPAMLRTNRKGAEQIVQIAENLIQFGDDIDIVDAERTKQFINAELDNAFGNLDLSEPAKNAKKRITAYIGEQLDRKLADVPGEFRELKMQYGALSAIEDDVLKRAIVFERQNPEGLADMLTKTEAAADIAFGGVQGRVRGMARLAMQSRLKKANDANELVKRAFEKLIQN